MEDIEDLRPRLPIARGVREWFHSADPEIGTRKLTTRARVYTAGDRDRRLYVVERGSIKSLVVAASGRECVVDVFGPGDVFGEACLAGVDERLDTTETMESSIVKSAPCDVFLSHLKSTGLLTGFLEYVIARLTDRQHAIAALLTLRGEERLARTILRLARKSGRRDASGQPTERRVSHQELSEMIGTTRPRVSEFLEAFRARGLVASRGPRTLLIDEAKLSAYVESSFDRPQRAARSKKR